MEALGDHGTQHGGSVAVLGRAGSRDSTRAAGTPGQNVTPPWQTNPMEAIGDHGTKRSGSVAVLGRAGSRVGAGFQGACDGGTPVERLPRLWRLSTAAAHTDAISGTEPAGLSDATETRDIGALRQALAVVNAAAMNAPEMLAMASYTEAADFAATAEEISRTVEYLQIHGAGAVERTRAEAITAAATARSYRSSRTGRSWITGWDNGTETLTETDTNWPADSPTQHIPASPADDGCKNTEEFLRVRLRIGISEARRRLRLAHRTLPSSTLTGDPIPPARQHLAAGLAPMSGDTANAEITGQEISVQRVSAPAVSSRAGTIISLTLDRLQHHTIPETLTLIEADLTRTAATADPDFLTRVARRWADAIDADGSEPSEEALRQTQGAFIRKPRHGLHHLEIFATTDQFEHLATVMNTATNPRTRTAPTSTNGSSTGTSTGTSTDGARTDTAGSIGNGADSTGVWQDNVDLDRRSRSQKQLDGIIAAVKAGLTTDTLPTTGGNRPQIIATINYQDLFQHHHTGPGTQETAIGPNAGPARLASPDNELVSKATGTGNFIFTGPIAAATLRKIACDADIIPALLGTDGEILDLGRKTRLFTPAQRLALTARDQGCTFPNCTIPAPWCEAHHITYWSQNGPTTTHNGALLCTHHHHLIHKEQWKIRVLNGVPWYIPPPHIDPTQKPQQNHFFKPPPDPPRLE